MTLYNQVSNNKTRTFIIFFLFILFISVFFFIIGKYFESPIIYFAFGITFSLCSVFISYFYSDKIVLFTLRAKQAKKQEYFNFYTVVENLSMAAGLSMPKLYVIKDMAPNAFATGRNPKHAIICATSGLLSKLDRTELEGVMAHELSHIKNYDILLASVLAVLVGTIALVSDWVLRSIFWRGDRKNKSLIAIALFVIMLIIAPLVATLIQLSLSRQREYMADASGALLTRYPEGLARALQKISSDPQQMRHTASSSAHLFIANPFKKRKGMGNWFTSLFHTHPPMDERIRILQSM